MITIPNEVASLPEQVPPHGRWSRPTENIGLMIIILMIVIIVKISRMIMAKKIQRGNTLELMLKKREVDGAACCHLFDNVLLVLLGKLAHALLAQLTLGKDEVLLSTLCSW